MCIYCLGITKTVDIQVEKEREREKRVKKKTAGHANGF